MRGLQRVGQPLGVLLSQKKEKIVKIMNPGEKKCDYFILNTDVDLKIIKFSLLDM